MAIRTTLSHVSRQAQMSMSRATIREFSDDHLMQEVKHADVMYSETPSDFERFQQVGMTSFPLKQEEDEKKKSGEKKPEASSADKNMAGQTDFNDDQPKGPAAEAVMLYLNGQRSHPIALVDDRRVRPYEMSEGEGAHYAPDGSEQMVLFKETGTYIVSLDNTSVKDKKNKKTRFVSLRHVEKKMQTHKIEENQKSESGDSGGSSPVATTRAGETSSSGGQQKKEKYKHEGDSVNTEVRCTKNRIEFRTGDKVVGYYDVQNEEWKHTGKTIKNEAQSISHKGVQYFDKSIHVKETVYATEGLKPGNGPWGDGIPSEGPSLLDASVAGDPIELPPHIAAYVARKQKQADDLEARLAAMEARLAALERA
jgi:phage gp45-like